MTDIPSLKRAAEVIETLARADKQGQITSLIAEASREIVGKLRTKVNR